MGSLIKTFSCYSLRDTKEQTTITYITMHIPAMPAFRAVPPLHGTIVQSLLDSNCSLPRDDRTSIPCIPCNQGHGLEGKPSGNLHSGLPHTAYNCEQHHPYFENSDCKYSAHIHHIRQIPPSIYIHMLCSCNECKLKKILSHSVN